MRRVALKGLVRIDFPGWTVRLASGGFLRIPDDGLYRARDARFGQIGGLSSLSEGVGQEVPVLELTLLPPDETLPADLSRPGYQAAPAKLSIAEYDYDTGLPVGVPDLLFDGQVDQTKLIFGKQRVMKMTVVSAHARLMDRNIGNSLNPSWHKSVWPGETGHDQATGLAYPRAWGVEAPQGAGGGGAGVYGGVGAGRFEAGRVVNL